MFDFEAQRQVGEQGVKWFLARYGSRWERNDLEDVRAVDLINKKGNRTLELKTDTYKSSKNFFMEYESHNGNLGGVYRAMDEGAYYFAYLFIHLNKIFVMRTEDALRRTEEVRHKYPLKTVRNKNYTSTGYAIPISEYEGLFVELKQNGACPSPACVAVSS
jgi:hypothetical protein